MKHIERLYARASLEVQRGDVLATTKRRYLVVDVVRRQQHDTCEVFHVDPSSWLAAGLVVEGRTPVVHQVKLVVRLRTFAGDDIEFREGVPPSRAHCVSGPRPCPYVRCKWHLWRIDASDRAGNPNIGNGPSTTLRAAWLESPIPPSCALDFVDKGESSSSEIADALGMDRGNVWLIWQRPHVRQAFEKLRELLLKEPGAI